MKSLNFKCWIVSVGLCLGLFTAPTSADLFFDFGGTTYELIETGRPWLEAATDAVSRTNQGLPGQLVRVDSQAENDAIFNALIGHIDAADFGKTLGPDGGGGSYVWIGATDRGSNEGQWIWDGDGDGTGALFWEGKANGTKENDLYNNWGMFPDTERQTEPDDFGPGQDTGGISLNGWPLGTAGQWNDVDEANDLYYGPRHKKCRIGIDVKSRRDDKSRHVRRNAFYC